MNLIWNMKKLVDLFAGAGGLSKGLEMAGFKSILANENLIVESPSADSEG